MKKVLIAMVFLLTAAVSIAADKQSGTIVMEFDLSARPESGEAKLWVPYPVSDADQLISNIRIEGDYAESAVYTDREYGTPMLFARWNEGAESRRLSFSFDVERNEVLVRELQGGEKAWNRNDFAPWLEPTRLGPTDGVVKALADDIVEGRTTVLGKARAVYDWTVENMYRDPDTRGCGPGDVCTLLQTRGGKCGDIHSVYVALARSAGVPAREVFGIRQGRKDGQDITGWQHCWVEFYLPGTGWIPVDPGDVRKMMLKEELELDDEKTAEYRAYFWGGIDPYRVKLSTGRDLILNPPQQGDPVNYLMYPFAQIGGETLDWLDPEGFSYRITYRQ